MFSRDLFVSILGSTATSLISAASTQMAIGSSAALITQAPLSGIGTSQLSIPLPIVQPLVASQVCALLLSHIGLASLFCIAYQSLL